MKPSIWNDDASADRLPEGSPEHLQTFFTDSVGCMEGLFQRYGPLVAFSKGSQRIVFAFTPETNGLLFRNPDVFHSLGFVSGPKNSSQRRLGNGVFNLNGARHKQHRRLMLPLFQKEMLDSYRAPLGALTDQLLAGWQYEQEYDLLAEIKELARRITARLLFGLEDFSLAAEIDAAFEQWLETNHHVAFQSMLPVEPSDESYERMLLGARAMEKLIGTLIAEREQTAPGPDLLSLLLRARDAGAVSAVDVLAEATHMFNAAYHTTTYAMTWTLFLLAQHPVEMLRVYEDLSAGRGPSFPHLDRCIKESLRLLPPVVYFARSNVEPFSLGAHHLSRGTLVIGSHYVTHRLPNLYPDPERFLPDRWLGAAPGPYGYIPFGGGARMCVGAAFSQLIFETCLGQILRRFRLAVAPGARIDRKCSLTLGPRWGVPVTVHRPDRQYACAPVVGDIHELVALPAASRRSAAA